MKKLRNMMSRALADNRGSGFAMVLICMLCIALMATTMLYMSFIGLRIKVTDREATEDFYDAAAAIDEICAELQSVASDSVATSYKNTLLSYNSSFEGTGTAELFRSGFFEAICAWTKKWEDGSSSPLIKDALHYDTLVLMSFIKRQDAELVTTADEATWEYNESSGEITFNNIHVRYTDPSDGYTTDVSTDISVKAPSFTYVMSEYSVSGLPEFAVIAKETLLQSTENGVGSSIIQILGSAYAKNVTLEQNAGSLYIEEGTLVCADRVSVGGNGGTDSTPRMLLSSNSTLWAGRIEVVDGGYLALYGTTYVADDLDLVSNYVKADLRGRYFGFGSSTTDPSRSSAILINGIGSTLDMSSLDRLMLAGFSFISNSYFDLPTDYSDSTAMGESISARRNQEAYLIPVEYLTGANGNPSVDAGTVELNDEGKAALALYGGTMKQVNTKLPGATQTVTYYFVDFESSAMANEFFKDYFTENSEDIAEYLNSYMTLRTGEYSIVQTAGYTLNVDEDGNYELSPIVAENDLNASTSQMESTFTQLKATLFDRNNSGATNPYDHLVTDGTFSDLSDEITEFKNGDEVVGLIVKSDYTIESGVTPSTVRVVISADGCSVTVASDFDGLIISGNNIVMSNSSILRADATNVATALTAKNDRDVMLSEYLLDGVVGSGGETSEESDSLWDFSDLVTYKNWSKN